MKQSRDGPLFFNQGEGVPFWGFADNFSKKRHTFQTIFSLHFVIKTIFYDQSEECKGLVLDLIKKTSCVFICMEKSNLNENKFTLYELCAVWWRAFSMEEAYHH